MTKKDYIKLAGAFEDGSLFGLASTTRNRTDGKDSYAMWAFLREKVADILEADSPRFSRDRFYAATEGR